MKNKITTPAGVDRQDAHWVDDREIAELKEILTDTTAAAKGFQQEITRLRARIIELEREADERAFELTPAMVVARNDQLVAENERLRRENEILSKRLHALTKEN